MRICDRCRRPSEISCDLVGMDDIELLGEICAACEAEHDERVKAWLRNEPTGSSKEFRGDACARSGKLSHVRDMGTLPRAVDAFERDQLAAHGVDTLPLRWYLFTARL